MGMAASIIGGVLGSNSGAGQQSSTTANQMASGGSIANNANSSSNQADIKTAEVKEAAKPMTQSETPVTTEKTQSNGNGKDWSQLANMAQKLMSSNGRQSQSQDVSFNATSQAQPLARF